MSDRARRGRRPVRGRFSTRARPHRRRRVLLCLLLVPTVLLPTSVSAQDRSSSELERDVGEVEARERALEEELDGVRQDLHDAEVELARIAAMLEDARGRLVAAEGQVLLAEAALVEAEEDRDAAHEAHVRAEERLTATEAELEAEEEVFTQQIVQTFKYGTVGATRGAMVLEVLRRAEDPNAFAVGMKQLQTVVDDQDTVVQNVFDLRERRSEQADDAARARAQAAQMAADAADTLRTVEGLREEAAAIAAEVEHEEEQQRVVLASLRTNEAETAALLDRVAERKKDLQRELADQRAREEEQRRKEAAAAAAAAAAAGSGTGRLGLPGADGGPPVDGMICPVPGAVAGRDYSNDWGYPRSGGRTHQGNDIFAGRGTPVVAVADGQVTSWNPPGSPTRLGGITVTYRTGDGSEWYNAHLDTVADGVSPGVSVSRGQVIGTVGNTGNAASTPPHLHLGRRYGGSWVNPWPTTSSVCR